MPLDWATSRFLADLSQADTRLRHPVSVDDLRALAQWIAVENGPGPRMESVENVSLEDDGVPAARLRVLQPRGWVPAVVVYLPGPAWGWVAGSLDSTDTVCRKLAERSGCTFVVVEHRKAPEHPYPAAVNDAWQALLWAEDYRRRLPGPTPPLVLAGEGSGGGLAAVLALRSRRAGGPAVGAAVLISPSLDPSVHRTFDVDCQDDAWQTQELAMRMWDSYLPESADRTIADVAPLRARDLTGHPPTLLLAAEHDPLRGQGEEYVARLLSAGVHAEQRVFPKQIHGFFGVLSLLMGERAFQDVVRKLRQYASDYGPIRRRGELRHEVEATSMQGGG